MSLAGCEPKFIVRYHENGNYVQQEYFFKPAWASYVALNELVAYHVDQLLGFHRVPPVVPMQIPYNQKILPALKLARQMQLEHHVFKKCRMKLEDKDIKEWIKFSPKRTDNLRDKHDDSLVVIGSMQLQVPDVIQRNKMVRYVDKRLKRSELLSRSMSESLQSILVPRAPSIFAERELGTRAIFDYLIGNRDRFHNDHILSMAEGENRILVYIDNNRVQIENTSAFDLQDWTRECRFYYAPVQKLFELCRDRPAIKGRNRFSLGCNGLTQRLWSHIMHHQPNSFETMISSWAEPPRPILRYEDIPFFSHLPKRVGHIIQRVEDCLRQKGFHHVFVEQ